MSKKQETLEMAAMLATGMNYRQIGDICGVAVAAVGQRLRRMGKPPVRVGTTASRLDKNRLIVLYELERLSLVQIAAACSVEVVRAS